MTVNEMLKAIHDCGCDEPPLECGCAWRFDGEDYTKEGESCDDVPGWTLYESVCGGWVVKREMGWYEQRGDAEDEAGVVALANAMNEADAAFWNAVWRSRK